MDNVTQLINYYGLDWLSMGMALLSIFLLASRKRVGFLTGIGAGLSGCAFGVLIESFPIMGANLMFVCFNAWGYISWKRRKK